MTDSDRFEGWKEIARALCVDEKTARKYAARNSDPLPVRHGHAGLYALRSALASWVTRQDRSHQDVRLIRRLEQVAREGPAQPAKFLRSAKTARQ